MKPIQLFTGFDKREAIGWHVFCYTLLNHSSRPVSITPLSQCGVDAGSNAFTLSRFLVPYLMGFKGHAIFADGCDMMMLGDIADLDDLYDPQYAVQVVQHPAYDSQHERKYIGTEMECVQSNYECKNWASLMLINCEHPAWSAFNLDQVCDTKPIDLLQFSFLADEEIGKIPPEWNVLIDEGQSDSDAKIIHWSNGIPYFSHYQNARRSRDWFEARYKMTDTRL